MKIGVFGNCASPVVAIALQQMFNDAEVLGFEAGPVRNAGALETVEAVLSSCDVVIANDWSGEFAALSYSRLKNIFPKVLRLPAVAFTGFHPDCAYLTFEQAQYASPMGAYNSSIVAAAFAKKLSPSDAISLFNADTFSKMGYFDEFAKAKAFLKIELERSDLDIEDLFSEWSKADPFMYTINHPAACFVGWIARSLAVKAGLSSTKAAPFNVLPDLLSINSVWPVYPEIAKRVNVKGGYLFKTPGGPNYATGKTNYLSLAEFVHGSFQQYANYPDGVFHLPSVRRTVETLGL